MIPKEEPKINAYDQMPRSSEVDEVEARLLSEPYNVGFAVDETFNRKKYESLKNTFDVRPTPLKLAKTLVQIWRTNDHFSDLHYDPEILETCCKFSAWFIRNKPTVSGDTLYFISMPFVNNEYYAEGVRIQPAITLLTDLWLEQVNRFPDDLRIARNASKLCRRIHITSPDDHVRIMKHVGKTAVGKRALRLEKY